MNYVLTYVNYVLTYVNYVLMTYVNYSVCVDLRQLCDNLRRMKSLILRSQRYYRNYIDIEWEGAILWQLRIYIVAIVGYTRLLRGLRGASWKVAMYTQNSHLHLISAI